MTHRLLFTTIFTLLGLQNLWSQKEFKVVDFSENYSASIVVNDDADPEELYEPNAVITFTDKFSGKKVFTTDVYLNIDYDLDDEGDVKSNIVELPYGEQSVVICDDFNCDGKEDIALLIGYVSCYGGPGYDVFLQDEAGQFVLDEKLSYLAQGYCGFFSYDCGGKKIMTMTKSGCCWHQTEEYELVDHRPVLRTTYVEDYISDVPTTTITKWNGEEKISETKEIHFEYEDGVKEPVLQFNLQDRNKTVLLAISGEGLCYYFLDGNNIVELEYKESFSLTKNGDAYKLQFSRPGARYEIYSDENSLGINVTMGKKVYNMKGIMPEKHNALSYLWGMDLGNLEFKGK